jgi:hypothetical protein
MRILNKLLLVLILILIFSFTFNKRNKIIEYQFESNNKYLSKYNFTVTRIIYEDEDKEIIDYGIFCDDTLSECNMRLMHERFNQWYIWSGSRWENLFQKQQLRKVEFDYTNKIIYPLGFYLFCDDTLHSFTYKNNDVDYTSDNNEYLFSRKKGVVIIKNESTFFKRNDYINDCLKDVKVDDFKLNLY